MCWVVRNHLTPLIVLEVGGWERAAEERKGGSALGDLKHWTIPLERLLIVSTNPGEN